MIPFCCTLCQAKCERSVEGGAHTCTCPDGYAGDGTICYASLLEVSFQDQYYTGITQSSFFWPSLIHYSYLHSSSRYKMWIKYVSDTLKSAVSWLWHIIFYTSDILYDLQLLAILSGESDKWEAVTIITVCACMFVGAGHEPKAVQFLPTDSGV